VEASSGIARHRGDRIQRAYEFAGLAACSRGNQFTLSATHSSEVPCARLERVSDQAGDWVGTASSVVGARLASGVLDGERQDVPVAKTRMQGISHMRNLIKEKALDLYRYNVLPRIEALHSEQVYQGIFDQQCRNLGIENTFYPVGAAASYSLMYLLARTLQELPVGDIVELGSGQTTLLIDRVRRADGRHVTYENNAVWAEHLATQLRRCDYRHRPLTTQHHGAISFEGYADLEPQRFDLLLVDGPNGTDHRSRFSCVPLIDTNPATEFMVIIDDASRPGEQETISEIASLLQRKGIDFKLNGLHGRTSQAVFTTPRFRAASYFY
jgi:predicted O-methyltransferase YrrM